MQFFGLVSSLWHQTHSCAFVLQLLLAKTMMKACHSISSVLLGNSDLVSWPVVQISVMVFFKMGIWYHAVCFVPLYCDVLPLDYVSSSGMLSLYGYCWAMGRAFAIDITLQPLGTLAHGLLLVTWFGLWTVHGSDWGWCPHSCWWWFALRWGLTFIAAIATRSEDCSLLSHPSCG